MNGLRELQRDFLQSVFSGDDRITDRIVDHGPDAAHRLAIYRNNTLLGLTEALENGFPVVRRLVGDAFFDGLARAFIAAHPPRSGCLIEYGERFPVFVAGYAPAACLPYLCDVAELEWLCQQSRHEADVAPPQLSGLASVPAARYGELRFRLHPSARWMVSRYPLHRIWEVNQSGYSGDDRVDLREGGCRLMIFRPGWNVEIHRLQPGEHCFLTTLAGHSSVTNALKQALDADERFDLLDCLRRWIGRGLITDFSL